MRLDKLTHKFQQALSDAQSLAISQDNNVIEPVHVMLALIDQQDGSTAALLTQAELNVQALKAALVKELGNFPVIKGEIGQVGASSNLVKLLTVTEKLAQQRKDEYISSELFVLAALEDKGILGKLLKQFGADKSALEQAIDKMRGGASVQDPN
ncbi:MAG: ATPase, ATP-binding subunit, partial [Gammaproteobacteria bacterium]|nr:ATPase, ATP-binding subunit [Gammaproteobacteria bacterium]